MIYHKSYLNKFAHIIILRNSNETVSEIDSISKNSKSGQTYQSCNHGPNFRYDQWNPNFCMFWLSERSSTISWEFPCIFELSNIWLTDLWQINLWLTDFVDRFFMNTGSIEYVPPKYIWRFIPSGNSYADTFTIFICDNFRLWTHALILNEFTRNNKY